LFPSLRCSTSPPALLPLPVALKKKRPRLRQNCRQLPVKKLPVVFGAKSKPCSRVSQRSKSSQWLRRSQNPVTPGVEMTNAVAVVAARGGVEAPRVVIAPVRLGMTNLKPRPKLRFKKIKIGKVGTINDPPNNRATAASR